MTAVLWFRRDLRIGDQPALLAAAAEPWVALFVIDPPMWRRAGAARRAWLAASVKATWEALYGKLSVRIGRPVDVVPALAREVGAGSVHVSGESTPAGRRRDAAVSAALATGGVSWVETGSPYAVSPGRMLTGEGTAYRVFTPFYRAWTAHGWRAPADSAEPAFIARLAPVDSDPDALRMLDAALAEGPTRPVAGEPAALARWQRFREGALATYHVDRDRPDLASTSWASIDLKVGAIHPRTLLHDLRGRTDAGATAYIRQLAWRDFYADVLWHHPASAWTDLTANLAGMPYADLDGGSAGGMTHAEAWQQGRTGYPIVDAGMRQLLATGWMHNRVRMITASFFTKDLHLWWPAGARHFLDHLIDGDVASNSHGWQWVAGTGTDAAPYFRVFNPIRQGLAFDPAGDYVRRWIPELAHLPGAAAHEPWNHPDGYAHGYPARIVDHGVERREALSRYAVARDSARDAARDSARDSARSNDEGIDPHREQHGIPRR